MFIRSTYYTLVNQMIKVNLYNQASSSGRGVGFYAELLGKALEETGQVNLTTDNPDIVHYPFFDLFYPTLPLKKDKPTIVTIHDLTPLVFPELYPKGVKGNISLLRQWLSLQNVAAIITDSENSKKDIVKYFRISPQKIHVTLLYVDPSYAKAPSSKEIALVKDKFNLPDKFILTVAGGPNPNKNLPKLAEATKNLGIPLVITGRGMLQEVSEPVHPELKDLPILKKYPHIIFPGFVATPDLNCMYRLATAYCQPSLYEGFGMPVLEAMFAKCLVVSSNSSSLPEIYSPSTINFKPENQVEMEAALDRAIHVSASEKARLIKEAEAKAEQFTWERTASATIEVYKRSLK